MSRLGVVIAAKNDERYLPEQLRALQQQTVQPDEVIFVNDGSTDSTLDIMRRYADTNRHVKTLILDFVESVGCARATNRGVAESSCDLLYIASANDVIQSRALLSISEARQAFPDQHVYVGDVSGIRLGWGPTGSSAPIYLGPDESCELFGTMGIIHAAGCVISREAWDRFGGWDPDWWPYSETLTWHTSACRYGLVYTPNSLGWVRQHEGSASTTVLDREWRQPLMRRAVDFVLALEEPTRTRLMQSKLWEIREWAPDMAPLLCAEALR